MRPLNVTVLGSTGRTGRAVLTEALRRGHRITAFSRRAASLPDPSMLHAVVSGDGRDPAAVRQAVRGADAVIAIVAAATRRGPHQGAEVSRVVTEAMTELGVPRLVVTSAYPVVAFRPRLPIALLRFLLADAYTDLARMEQVVASSALEWTIARLNRLSDAAPAGRTRLVTEFFENPTGLSRADAASTLLDLAESSRFARTAVNIAGPVRR